MDTSNLLHRADLGGKIDRRGAEFLRILTTNPTSQNLDPIEQLQFAGGRLPSSVQTRIHQIELIGQFAHRFVTKDSIEFLYGVIEFRRLNDEGFPSGEPVFVVWIDEYGSYGVDERAGYTSMPLPDNPRAEWLFRSKVAASLFLKVQAWLLETAVAYGT